MEQAGAACSRSAYRRDRQRQVRGRPPAGGARGAAVVDADRLAREVVEPRGPPVWRRSLADFGAAVVACGRGPRPGRAGRPRVRRRGRARGAWRRSCTRWWRPGRPRRRRWPERQRAPGGGLRASPCWSRTGSRERHDVVVVVDAADDGAAGPAGPPRGMPSRTPAPGWPPRPSREQRLAAADVVIGERRRPGRAGRAGRRALAATSAHGGQDAADVGRVGDHQGDGDDDQDARRRARPAPASARCRRRDPVTSAGVQAPCPRCRAARCAASARATPAHASHADRARGEEPVCGDDPSVDHEQGSGSSGADRAVGGGPYRRGMRPVTDLERRVAPFEVVSDFVAVRRPAARRSTSSSSGSGPASRTSSCSAPPAPASPPPRPGWSSGCSAPPWCMAPNKTLAAQLANEFRELLPAQRGRVLRLLLRLLPARGVRPADGHLHREGLLDQRRGRAAAPLGDQQPAHPARRRRGGLGVVHLRPGHPAGVRRPDGAR